MEIKKKITHDFIKCELYRCLVNLGFEVYPEIKVDHMIIDLAVYHEDNLVCVIEVKNYSKRINPKLGGKQYYNYKRLGVPFFYCVGLKHINKTIKDILHL